MALILKTAISLFFSLSLSRSFHHRFILFYYCCGCCFLNHLYSGRYFMRNVLFLSEITKFHVFRRFCLILTQKHNKRTHGRPHILLTVQSIYPSVVLWDFDKFSRCIVNNTVRDCAVDCISLTLNLLRAYVPLQISTFFFLFSIIYYLK